MTAEVDQLKLIHKKILEERDLIIEDLQDRLREMEKEKDDKLLEQQKLMGDMQQTNFQ